MGRLFGTDGVRGVANKELTADLAFKLGQAGAKVLAAHNKDNPKILVGKDTRISGDLLQYALAAGISSYGAEAILAGTLPTPAIAYLTRLHKLDAGVVISASHNPFEYNGIKFFNGEGYKLSDQMEDEIEEYVLGIKSVGELPTGNDLGRVTIEESYADEYVDFIVNSVDLDLSGMKIAIDCANGAAYKVAPKIFQRLNAETKVLYANPDGVNINDNCGSTHMERLMETVVNEGCQLGLAFDGDADRMLACDHEGKLVDGDLVMAICANHMKEKGTLKKNTLVTTVMSNLGLFLMGKKYGINIEKSQVGDRYVLEKMLEKGYNIGGEQSGHIIFLDHNTTGDGLLSALQLLSIMVDEKKPLKQLAGIAEILPQVLVNAKVKAENTTKYIEELEIQGEIERIEKMFAENGRVLIRPSGTEPLVRVMIEGKDKEVITREAKALAALIEKKFND